MKILLSAYACRPGHGSEPGIGWNVATELARRHDVWVITRRKYRDLIDTAAARLEGGAPRFVYLDLPGDGRPWKRGRLGSGLYYYVWQFLAYRKALELHDQQRFDVTHHVTFGKYTAPSMLCRLPVPFIWGPVGGGESAPARFQREFSWSGQVFEAMRTLGRWLGERDPLVRATARGCTLALATTEETAVALRRIGATEVRIFSQIGAPSVELDRLAGQRGQREGTFRFVSVGRLLDWKGFHLGVRAFARSGLSRAEYWIIGGGPSRARLEALARQLGVGDRVHFLGEVPREETLNCLRRCSVLVHPSLHESGGWVCWEAMAAGCPVICLQLGGPASIVDEATGVPVRADDPRDAVEAIAVAMKELAQDPELWNRRSRAGVERVARSFRWDQKVARLSELYREAITARRAPEHEQSRA